MHDISKYNPTERFSNRAKHYSQARPDYPAEAMDFMAQRCQFSDESLICDIGAGTGISTRAFASRAYHLFGVEPNEAMLNEAKMHPDFSDRIQYVKATAEETGLDSGFFDAVVCAQAFHWFNPEKALLEFCRILKDGGWVLLIWNEREESDPFTKDYGDLLRTWPDTLKVETKRGKAGEPLLQSTLFQNQDRSCFPNNQVMTLEKLIKRALSASYAPAPETSEAEEFSEKLSELFGKYQQEGSVVMHYQACVYSGQKKKQAS